MIGLEYFDYNSIVKSSYRIHKIHTFFTGDPGYDLDTKGGGEGGAGGGAFPEPP